MPIPELAAARAKRAAVDVAIEHLYEERRRVRDQLDRVDNQIRRRLAGPERELAQAISRQEHTLTGWVKKGGSFNRYRLHEDPKRASDKCWDSKVWLRWMLHYKDDRRVDHTTAKWKWTLRVSPFDVHGGSDIVIDEDCGNIHSLGPLDLLLILAKADNEIKKAGWLLSDQFNFGDVPDDSYATKETA